MVLTVNQVTMFFKNDAYMGILYDTRVRIQVEGITTVPDLEDFNKEGIKQIAEMMKCPGGRIPNLNNPTTTIAQPPYQFGVKSQMRMV